MEDKYAHLSEKKLAQLRRNWENNDFRKIRNNNGSPTKERMVHDYLKEHPYTTKRACARNLGISITTVQKWWIDLDDRPWHGKE